MNFSSDEPIVPSDRPASRADGMRAIAYSMDTLIPGVYLWTPFWNWRFGGSVAESTYPGMVHRSFGMALVLPGYRIFTTYRDSYDPRSAQN
jgi:hypothetical protein